MPWNNNGAVEVDRSILVECVPHVAWGVFCSTNARIPEWVDENPGMRITSLFKLLRAGDDRAIEWMDSVTANPQGEWAIECCLLWRELSSKIKAID